MKRKVITRDETGRTVEVYVDLGPAKPGRARPGVTGGVAAARTTPFPLPGPRIGPVRRGRAA